MMDTINKNKKRIAIIVLIILLLAIFVIWRNSRSVQKEISEESIETVEVRDVIEKVSSEGNLAAIDNRDVYFPQQSLVKEVKVEIGDGVEKDQILAVVSVNVGGVGVDQNIVSPIDGRVSNINYSENDVVISSLEPAITVIDDSSYIVDVLINENDISKIKKGLDTTVVFPAISSEARYKGAIRSIAVTPVSTSGVVNYSVEITPERLPEGVRTGMSTEVEIIIERKDNVLSIPESFIIQRDNKNYVKKVTYSDEDKTQYTIDEIEVSVGLVTNEYVELKSGVSGGDQLVEPSFTVDRNFSFF